MANTQTVPSLNLSTTAGQPTQAANPTAGNTPASPSQGGSWRVTRVLGGISGVGALLVGGVLGLEYAHKAPWQDASGAKPVTRVLDDLRNFRMPGITPAQKAEVTQGPEAPTKPEQAAEEAAAPEAEIQKRELLKAGLEKAADIIFDRGAVTPPDIDLSSLEKTEQTLRAFASTVDKLPAQVRQKYALWGAIETLMKNFYEPEAVDKFNAAVDAIAEGRPIKAPPEKSKVPPSHEVPPEFRNLPHFIYLDHKETALPAIKESLRPFDALLQAYGVPSPENRLDTLSGVTWTLTEYSNAIWRVDPYHPAVESLQYESDRLAKAPEETLKKYEKDFATAKVADENYRKAQPELKPLLDKVLDQISGGLMAYGQQEPERDFSSLTSATETLIKFQTAITRAAPGSPDVGLLNDVIYGLKNDPKSQIGGLKAYLEMGDAPSK